MKCDRCGNRWEMICDRCGKETIPKETVVIDRRYWRVCYDCYSSYMTVYRDCARLTAEAEYAWFENKKKEEEHV